MAKGLMERAADALSIRPTAAKLAEQLEALRGQVEYLAGEHEQAEANAVALAGDEDHYADAAALADRLRGELAEKRARLERLEKAHADAVTRERDEEIARLNELRVNLRERRIQVYAETRAGEEAEQKRFEAALEGFRRQRLEVDRHGACLDRLIEGLSKERFIEANKRVLLKRAGEMQPGTYRPEDLVALQGQLSQCDEALADLAQRIPGWREHVARLPA